MGFQVKKAVREKIYVKVALMAPSGGGKTYSSLRVATGMAEELEKINGKKPKILLANTEQKRGYYYANEFAYDIVDMEAPHSPERYVELIEFAVNEGYDILILDSSSHEWEGKGGCLDIQQQLGGNYQAWAKVTPRHDKFINAIAESKIHIIATMRGKDQYEMEKDQNGKTTVKKLGIGAKQRDGFEYEFTCTFLLDQKTNMAESQKDNTHLFENQGATLLSEKDGKKIIQWANSGEATQPQPTKKEAQPEKAKTEEKDVKINFTELKAKTVELCTAKMGSVGKEKITQIISENLNGKTLKEAKKEDYEAVEKLYNALSEIQ